MVYIKVCYFNSETAKRIPIQTIHECRNCVNHVLRDYKYFLQKTKGTNLMELVTATGKLKKFFLDN
jgi:hypothetical protein